MTASCSTQTFPAIEELLPHGVPMRALEELLEWESGRARCGFKIRAHHPLVGRRGAPGSSLVEFMAQGIAVCLGYEAYRGGSGVRVGMIVSVRQFNTDCELIPVGQVLQVTAERVFGTDEASTFRTATLWGELRIASAQMTVVHPDAPPEEE